MEKSHSIILFNKKEIRRFYDEDEEKWYFSVVDVIGVLTDSENPAVYWRVLKKRLKDEGSNQTVTKCNGLKMRAVDGKMRLTDAADTETLLRLIQSIPSPKAEPFKLWLAKVGYERITNDYNNEGLMTLDDIKETMSLRGEYRYFTKDYNRFKADRAENREYKSDKTVEYLHYVVCN
jgi:hypothetical protein